jgi:hypothetical protein
MSLLEEVEEIFAKEVGADPVWGALAKGGEEDTLIEVSGDLQETLQTTTNAVTHYCDALLKMVLHIATAVDDLQGRVPIDRPQGTSQDLTQRSPM